MNLRQAKKAMRAWWLRGVKSPRHTRARMLWFAKGLNRWNLFAFLLLPAICGCGSSDEPQDTATTIMVRGLDAEIRSLKDRQIEVETEWDARYKFLGDLTETIRREHGRAIDELRAKAEERCQ